MHHGRKSRLITAYSALATVSIGLIAFDLLRRTESGSQLVDQPAQRVFALFSPVAPQAKGSPVPPTEQSRTVASYTARQSTP